MDKALDKVEQAMLCIESTGDFCSVAWTVQGKVQFYQQSTGARKHAEELASMAQALVEEAGCIPNAVAISMGPGSYTGLRIGVSLAKGLCFGWNVPLIAVDTLHMLALAMANEIGLDKELKLVPMTDARRMEVYTAVYNEHGKVLEAVHPKVLLPDDFKAYLDGAKVVFAGSGAEKWKSHCSFADQAIFLTDLLPNAEQMAEPAYKSLMDGVFCDLAYFEPFYLKPYLFGKKPA